MEKNYLKKKHNNVGLDYELVHWTVTWQFAKVIITINLRANNYYSNSTISSLIYSEILEAGFIPPLPDSWFAWLV